MKKFALVLLVMGVMVLGFGLLTASAQGTSGNTTVTVTVTDSNVTVSPNTLPLNVPVTFNFTNNGSSAHAFVIEKEGASNVPLTSGSNTASFNAIAAAGTFSTTWTFTEAGSYQIAAYNNGTLESGLVAMFTVAAQADATATVSPTAQATASPTVTATVTMTATTAVTTTTTTTGTTSSGSAASTGASPSSLPTTGGESNWAAMLLAFGVAALLLGGALTFGRRAR